MAGKNWVELILLIALLAITARPMGLFFQHVFEGKAHFLSRIFGGLER